MDNNNPPSIRQQAEDLLGCDSLLNVLSNGDTIIGWLDGVGQYGLWIEQEEDFCTTYIPYSDIESIRVADPEEV